MARLAVHDLLSLSWALILNSLKQPIVDLLEETEHHTIPGGAVQYLGLFFG